MEERHKTRDVGKGLELSCLLRHATLPNLHRFANLEV